MDDGMDRSAAAAAPSAASAAAVAVSQPIHSSSSGIPVATAANPAVPVPVVPVQPTTVGPEIEMSSATSTSPTTHAAVAESDMAPSKLPSSGQQNVAISDPASTQSVPHSKPSPLDLASANAVGLTVNLTSQIPFDLPSASSPASSPTFISSHSNSSHFPILPASQPLPNQTVQTATQVASILSLPAPLLLNLARTTSPSEQRKIATKMHAVSYLSSMALPPPSPSQLVPDLLDNSLGMMGSQQATGPTTSADGRGHANDSGSSSALLAPTSTSGKEGRRPSLPITSIGDHPAIPLLLGQVFSPPTPGIVAPATPANDGPNGWFSHNLTFASVEDWSYKAARERVGQAKLDQARSNSTASTSTSTSLSSSRPSMPTSKSFSEREISTVAKQMARWALREQVDQVGQQVDTNKETAVLLAAQAAARTATGATNGANDPEAEIDLSAYADTYKRQLDALASGYFAQLHREALKRIASAIDPNAAAGESALETTGSPLMTSSATAFKRSPSPIAPTTSSAMLPDHNLSTLSQIAGTEQAQAIHVQAAAAAAIAANALAAKEMASAAGTTLENLGVEVPKFVPDRPKGVGFDLLELRPETIAMSPTSQQPKSPTVEVTAPTSSQYESTQEMSAPSIPVAGSSTSIAASLSPSQPPAAVTSVLEQAQLGQDFTPEKRDYLLSYAHSLYAKDSSSTDLLPLLHMLEEVHPGHLPTLLLTSCVYYTRGEYESSLFYNKKLLDKDPSYVEAMSNIGTTLRAMGKWREAEQWWWKAIKLRPTYWDATENLLGVLCNPSTSVRSSQNGPSTEPPPPTTPRYQEALELCNFVESQVFAIDSNLPTVPFEASRETITAYNKPLISLVRPRRLPSIVPTNHVHRLQNLLYAKGNLRMAMGDAAAAQDEYEKAVEVALSLPAWARTTPSGSYPIEGCTTRDLVVAAFIVAKVLATHAQVGANSDASHRAVSDTLRRLGVTDAQGRFSFSHVVAVVRRGGDRYVEGLMKLGGGVLPTVLIAPEHVSQLLPLLFYDLQGALPSMREADRDVDPQRAATMQQANQTTSTMLLTLAKVFQDASAIAGSANIITLGGIPCSPSLLLPLYYVALALYPSPSTCNNLGILLSTVNANTLVATNVPNQPPVLVSGQDFALRYYYAGLKLDAKHPHLYTNLGSLLKDMGQLQEAIRQYKKAVECNPNFDVALANLANAVKDSGQIQESIPYYKRAVEINPNFPEAICGLVNALGGVCDWTGRGGVNEPWIVDNNSLIVEAPAPAPAPGELVSKSGYMGQISSLVAKQLADGMNYGVGSMRLLGGLDEWLALISQSIYGLTPDMVGEAMATWKFRVQFLLDPANRKTYSFNEGGFLIRLVERLMRRIQRRWYLTSFGPSVVGAPSAQRITPTAEDLVKYRRPMLPPSLPAVAVPTVLPFHCFTLPVTARETRLISHRTGLRISHSTLNQPWMPGFVYPPPRPPVNGVLNIGYVSSDLGNHPLSHLMQSVFGMHDHSRFNVFVYATSPSDRSPYRLKIEAESQHFYDVSACSTQQIVDQIVHDEIHVLINLSGYTKGARNEVFAARPAPVQMSYMGFAGPLSAGWCDYFIVDPIVCPPSLVSGDQWRLRSGLKASNPEPQGVDTPTDFEGDPDPEAMTEDYVYTEKLLYLPHSYFVTDHKQAWREDESAGLAPGDAPFVHSGTPAEIYAIEEARRWHMRRELFPGIRNDTFIFANWNQLYKIDPFIFRIWLSILAKFPNSILWLLRFPASGEAHLKETALKWAGQDVADRVIFTDVANKNEHVQRGRIADLFLDTTECNAHTTAADILWSGTPLLTYPRHLHKMASRVAASIAVATGLGAPMIVSSAEEYEARALQLASSLSYDYVLPDPSAPAQSIYSKEQRIARGQLAGMRRILFLNREKSPLFDTKRWVQNMEKGVFEAWRRWVSGTEFEDAGEWGNGPERETGCLWVSDVVDGQNAAARQQYFK